MNENLLKVLSIYCDNEIENLKNSELFIKLQKLVNELNYNLIYRWGKSVDKKQAENLYLGIEILDDKNEEIEIYDDGILSVSTLLVLVDKKHRYKFFSWNDEDFIDDLNWFIRNLENIKNAK